MRSSTDQLKSSTDKKININSKSSNANSKSEDKAEDESKLTRKEAQNLATWKKLTKKYPNLKKLDGISGTDGLHKLQRYMNTHLNHRSGGSTSFEGVQRSGHGDCWGLAAWAATVLKYNNYDARIVQGPNSYSSNHRWVQVKVNKRWVNFESSLVTKRYGSKSYTRVCAKVRTVVKSM